MFKLKGFKIVIKRNKFNIKKNMGQAIDKLNYKSTFSFLKNT